MIGARASSRCDLCRRERDNGQESVGSLPKEKVVHIQSAGCKHRDRVIGAHHKRWKYLIFAITKHWEAKCDFEFIGEDRTGN